MAVKNIDLSGIEAVKSEAEQIKSSEQTSEKRMSKPKSYANAILEGLSQGTIGLASFFYEPEEGQTPEEYYQEYRGAKQGLEKAATETFPYEPGVVEGILNRAGKIAPAVALAGPGLGQFAAQTTMGALGGESAKAMGFGPVGQAVGELGGIFSPSMANLARPGRFTAANAAQEELANLARSQGLSEGDITLSAGQRGVVRDVAENLAYKGPSTVEKFQQTKQNLGRVWEDLKLRPEAQMELSGKQSSDLINNMSKTLSKLPAEQRKLIQTDFNDLLSTQMTGKDVIDFWQKLNYYISKGESALGLLKKDMKVAINELSPQLGKDFELTNDLYANFARQAERMGPDITDKLLNLGESGILLNSIVTGNVSAMEKVLKLIAGRALAKQMVVNPRFQNLSTKFISAMQKRSLPAMNTTFNNLINEVGKENAEAARILSSFNVEDFYKKLSSTENEKR